MVGHAACHDARHDSRTDRREGGYGPAPGPAGDRGRVRHAGTGLSSLTTRLPRVQDRWDLGELALSGVLLMMVLLAGAGSLVAERLAPRLDSAVVLRAGLLVIAVSVAVLVLAPTTVVLVLGLGAYGLGLGLVDATSNMQAVALEHRMGRVRPTSRGGRS